jgi:hypothetical protein
MATLSPSHHMPGVWKDAGMSATKKTNHSNVATGPGWRRWQVMGTVTALAAR